MGTEVTTISPRLDLIMTQVGTETVDDLDYLAKAVRQRLIESSGTIAFTFEAINTLNTDSPIITEDIANNMQVLSQMGFGVKDSFEVATYIGKHAEARGLTIFDFYNETSGSLKIPSQVEDDYLEFTSKLQQLGQSYMPMTNRYLDYRVAQVYALAKIEHELDSAGKIILLPEHTPGNIDAYTHSAMAEYNDFFKAVSLAFHNYKSPAANLIPLAPKFMSHMAKIAHENVLRHSSLAAKMAVTSKTNPNIAFIASISNQHKSSLVAQLEKNGVQPVVKDTSSFQSPYEILMDMFYKHPQMTDLQFNPTVINWESFIQEQSELVGYPITIDKNNSASLYWLICHYMYTTRTDSLIAVLNPQVAGLKAILDEVPDMRPRFFSDFQWEYIAGQVHELISPDELLHTDPGYFDPTGRNMRWALMDILHQKGILQKIFNEPKMARKFSMFYALQEVIKDEINEAKRRAKRRRA